MVRGASPKSSASAHRKVKPPLLEIAAFACSHLASKKKKKEVQRVVGRSLTQHMLRDVLCARANLERRKKKKLCFFFFFFLLDVVGSFVELAGSKAFPPQGSLQRH